MVNIYQESFYNEIMLMRCVKNKNILKLNEIWESANSYYLIMPVCHGGSLLERIAITKRMEKSPTAANQKELGCIDRLFIKQFMKQMLEALLSLKQQGILHRDLKPDNILLNSRQSVDPQIIDFGLGTFQSVENYIYPKCGTPGYVAPEIINMKEKTDRYDSQCDVFSLGAIFYFLLTLKPLFLGKITKETIDLNKRCFIDFNSPDLNHIDSTSKFIYYCMIKLKYSFYKAINLLRLMLEINPSDRITPEDALQHQYFEDNFLDDDCDIPDDPVTTINQTLTKFNYEKPFDMQRINNHSTLNKMLNSKIDQSSQSLHLMDGLYSSKKESSLLGVSLIMKQPIVKRNIGGKQISLEAVIVEEDYVIKPKNSNQKYDSPLQPKLKHTGTFEQSDFEFLDETQRIRVKSIYKERSNDNTETKYSRQNSKNNKIASTMTNSNIIFKKTLSRNDSLINDNSKQSVIKKDSDDINAK